MRLLDEEFKDWLASMGLLHGSMQCQCGADMKLRIASDGFHQLALVNFSSTHAFYVSAYPLVLYVCLSSVNLMVLQEDLESLRQNLKNSVNLLKKIEFVKG
uniref:Uncharacterized protein n=1 Tax=Acrobeloides nanus TaxID=290746 RepID=A0A914BZ25_9BILA